MKIIRYEARDGTIDYAVQHPGGEATRLRGDLFRGFEDSEQPADVMRLRAPLLHRSWPSA